MLRWAGGFEKALLGKFYGGQLLGRTCIILAKEPGRQSSICAHQPFLHPKIHNYSRNVRLVAVGILLKSGIFTQEPMLLVPRPTPPAVFDL